MKNLIAYFQTQENIELAYLFGSRATGRFTPTSDYDIGLKLKQPISFSEKFFMEVEIRKLLETQALDLVLIDEAPLVLKFNIICGKCLYAFDEATRIEYEANVMSRYYDFLPVLQKQYADSLRTVKSEQQIQRNRIALGKTEKLLAEIRAAQQENA